MTQIAAFAVSQHFCPLVERGPETDRQQAQASSKRYRSIRLSTTIMFRMSNYHKQNPETDFSNFQLLHELFRHRAADPIQTNLLAFPKLGFADYEYFTGESLDRFTDGAAWHYYKTNPRRVCQTTEHRPHGRQYRYCRMLICFIANRGG